MRLFVKWALLLKLLCLPLLAVAQLSIPLGAPVFRALDANGKPLSGGLLYSYAAGSSTPLATYADANRGAANANPMVLDSSGRANIFLGLAVYKFVLQDATGVQQWTIDNINGIPSPGSVSSVFGRTGAVVAVSGDYSCAQITGAVCSLPTIYYQTIQQSGSTLPAEPKLNLIPGGDISLTCADNSSNGSTDCTVGYTAPTSTADIWFTFSTCTIAQTGNTYNCPSTYSGSPFPITTGGSFHIGGCTAVTPGPVAGLFTITQNSVTSTGFSYNWTQVMGNGTSGTAAGAQVTCIIHFDS